MELRLRNGNGYSGDIVNLTFLTLLGVVILRGMAGMEQLIMLLNIGLLVMLLNNVLFRGALWLRPQANWFVKQVQNWLLIYGTLCALAPMAGFALPFMASALGIAFIAVMVGVAYTGGN